MIRPLSQDVRSHLRSGVAVTSYTQCVEELVLNALDARSTSVAVRVDLGLGKVQVVDNGQGINAENLQMIGIRYATSKCHSVDDLQNLVHYGYRGEAIASLVDTCLILEVESRHNKSTVTHTRIFNRGRAGEVTPSSLHRPSHGTTITVHDLFYSLPVRKKKLNETLEFERIRHRLEAIALVHPRISLSLRNDVSGAKVLQTHKTNSVLATFGHLFGTSKSLRMKQLECAYKNIKIQGYISTECMSNRSLQFIFINDRLILKTKLHKLINNLLAKSSVISKRKAISTCKPDSENTKQESYSPGNLADRHGIFVINISCPLSEYDITFEPAKTLVEFHQWPDVLKCLEDAVKELLITEGLISSEDQQNSSDVPAEVQTDESGSNAEDSQTFAPLTKPYMDLNPKYYGYKINTIEMSHSLSSATAKRKVDEQEKSQESVVAEQSEEQVMEYVEDRHGSPGRTLAEAVGQHQNIFDQYSHSSVSSSLSNSPCSPVFGSTLAQQRKAGVTNDNKVTASTCQLSDDELMEDYEESVPIMQDDSSNQSSARTSSAHSAVEMNKNDIMAGFQKIRANLGMAQEQEYKIAPCKKTDREHLLKGFQKIRAKLKLDRSLQQVSVTCDQVPYSTSQNVASEPIFPRTSQTAMYSTTEDNPRIASGKPCCLDGPKNVTSPGEVLTSSEAKHMATETYPFPEAQKRPSSESSVSISSKIARLMRSSQEYKSVESPSPSQDNISSCRSSQKLGCVEYTTSESMLQTVEDYNFSNTSQPTGDCASQNNFYNSPNLQTSNDSIPKSYEFSWTPRPMWNSCENSSAPNSQHTFHSGPSQEDFVSNNGNTEPKNKSESHLNPVTMQTLHDKLFEWKKHPILPKTVAGNSQESIEGKDQDVNQSTDQLHPGPSTQTSLVDSTKFVDGKEQIVDSSQVEQHCSEISEEMNGMEPGQSDDPPCISVEASESKTVNSPRMSTAVSSSVVNHCFGGEQQQKCVVEHDVPEKQTVYGKIEELHSDDGLHSTDCEDHEEHAFDDKLHEKHSTDDEFHEKHSTDDELHEKHSTDELHEKHSTDELHEKHSTDDELHEKHSTDELHEKHSTDDPIHEQPAFDDELHEKHNDNDKLHEKHPTVVELHKKHAADDKLHEKHPADDELHEKHSTDSELHEKHLADGELHGKHSTDGELHEKHLADGEIHGKHSTDGELHEKHLADGELHGKHSTDGELHEKHLADDKLYGKHPTVDELHVKHLADEKLHEKHRADELHEKHAPDCELHDNHATDDEQSANIYIQQTNSVNNDFNGTLCTQVGSHNEHYFLGSACSVLQNGTVSVEESQSCSSACCRSTDQVMSSTTAGFEHAVNADSTQDCHVSSPRADEVEQTESISKNPEKTSCIPDSDQTKGDVDAVPSSEHNPSNPASQWMTTTDSVSGRTMYINMVTGHSSYEAPPAGSSSQCEGSVGQKKHHFLGYDAGSSLMPRPREQRQSELNCSCSGSTIGLNSILEDHQLPLDEDEHGKWKDGFQQPVTESADEDESFVMKMWNTWTNPVFRQPEKSVLSGESSELTRSSRVVHQALSQHSITKHMLSSLQVLRQLDNKFIICLLKTKDTNLVVVIDQHAAHERIRLEKLIEDAYEPSADSCGKQLKLTQIDPPQTVQLSEDKIRILKSYRKQVRKCGVEWSMDIQQSGSVLVCGAPTCVLNRDATEVKRGRPSVAADILQTLILELIDTLERTGGVCSLLPRCVMRLLASQACHGAIKFGDPLTVSECEDLVRCLPHCDLPFQCAHGRPSLMPLLDLSHIPPPQKSEPPKLWKLKQMIAEQNTSEPNPETPPQETTLDDQYSN